MKKLLEALNSLPIYDTESEIVKHALRYVKASINGDAQEEEDAKALMIGSMTDKPHSIENINSIISSLSTVRNKKDFVSTMMQYGLLR